jgi:cation-transporting P-type ATPase D
MKLIFKLCVKLPRNKEGIINFIELNNENFDFNIHSIFINDLCELILNYEIIEINDKTNDLQTKYNSLNSKLLRKEKVKDWISCKRPVYENCKMLAPDNELLCFCDKKKMNWYLEKNLATLLTNDPPCFKLKFEPNARGNHPDDISSKFYLNHRKNCCVVCGIEENYMRFHIVPVVYRKFFPNEYKSHNSHDIVLLCLICHGEANKFHSLHKEIISKKFNVPLNTFSEEAETIKNFHSISSLAKNLVKYYNQMPVDKKHDMMKIIIDFLNTNLNDPLLSKFYQDVFFKDEKSLIKFPISNITRDLLIKIKVHKLKKSEQIETKNLHGKMIVNEIKDFHGFIREWRKTFIEYMKPRFLTQSWDIDHDFYSSFGRQSKFYKSNSADI